VIDEALLCSIQVDTGKVVYMSAIFALGVTSMKAGITAARMPSNFYEARNTCVSVTVDLSSHRDSSRFGCVHRAIYGVHMKETTSEMFTHGVCTLEMDGAFFVQG
jgi:hypothetical protein